MLVFRVVEAKELKNTQTLGKQSPYAEVSQAMDCGKIWSTCPNAKFREPRFAGAPLLKIGDSFSTPKVSGAGTEVKFPEDATSSTQFLYLPGANTFEVKVWNSNALTAPTLVGTSLIDLQDVLQKGTVDAWWPLYRPGGREQGSIRCVMTWKAGPQPPPTVATPVTLTVPSRLDERTGKYAAGFSIWDMTLKEAMKKVKADEATPEVASHLKTVLPGLMPYFGSRAVPLLRQGGAPISNVDPETWKAGLMQNDVILGYADDSSVKPEFRGIEALSNGQATWKSVADMTREQVYDAMKPLIKLGGITLTVLRPLPIQHVPSDHFLLQTFIVPPASVSYEPAEINAIVGQPISGLAPAVQPSKSLPLRYEAAAGEGGNAGLPAGIALDRRTGQVSGTPTEACNKEVQIYGGNACGKQVFTLKFNVMAAPTSLKYAGGHNVSFAINTPINPLTVETIDGTGPFTFSSPSLPAGLELDSATGAVSGTPTEPCALVLVPIEAATTAGVVQAVVVMSVVAPPTAFSYTAAALVCKRNFAIEEVAVTEVTGCAPRTFTSEPELPDGLRLDQATGALTGTPSLELAEATYTITAANMAGFASFSIAIEVLEPPADLQFYQGQRGAMLRYTQGLPATDNGVKTVMGTRPLTYSVAPAFPAGMSIDPENGDISGTPTKVVAPQVYTVSASNKAGAAVFPLLIEVVVPEPEEEEELTPDEASGAGEALDDFAEEGAEIKAFLNRAGCGAHLQAFLADGWDSLDAVYSMSEVDLKELGLSADEVKSILAVMPGAAAAKDTDDMRDFLVENGCGEYAKVLSEHGVRNIGTLLDMEEPGLVHAGMKRGHARKLLTAIVARKASDLTIAAPAPAPPPAAGGGHDEALPLCGVGLKIVRGGGKMGKWRIAEVVPGGSADKSGVPIVGDRIVMLKRGENTENEPGARTLQEIKVFLSGVPGTRVSLTLKRAGTFMDCDLECQPCEHLNLPLGLVTIKIVSASDLPACDSNGLCDPYVVLACNHKHTKTKVIYKSRFPKWDQKFDFGVNEDARLIASVWDKDTMTGDDLIGKFSVKLADLIDIPGGTIKQGEITQGLVGRDGKPVMGVDGSESQIIIEVTKLRLRKDALARLKK